MDSNTIDLGDGNVQIGPYILRKPYGEDCYAEPHIALYKTCGEGGDFPVSKLVEALDKFYDDNF